MNWKTKLKWGDEELKTPEHDEIMIWLDKNCISVAQKLFPDLEKDKFEKQQWEFPFITEHGSILCFIDLFLSGKKLFRGEIYQRYNLLFEVKPKIESIGELIRQLQSYKHYYSIQKQGVYDFSLCKIVVVSPDEKAKDIILNNGFYYFNPEKDMVVE